MNKGIDSDIILKDAHPDIKRMLKGETPEVIPCLPRIDNPLV
jgi:hypothetical protein